MLVHGQPEVPKHRNLGVLALVRGLWGIGGHEAVGAERLELRRIRASGPRCICKFNRMVDITGVVDARLGIYLRRIRMRE